MGRLGCLHQASEVGKQPHPVVSSVIGRHISADPSLHIWKSIYCMQPQEEETLTLNLSVDVVDKCEYSLQKDLISSKLLEW